MHDNPGVLLCASFVFKGVTSFAASYVLVLFTSRTGYHVQTSGEISIAAMLFGGTARMSEGKFIKFSHLLCPTLQKERALKLPTYLVPGTWYTNTRYCCVRVLCFRAPSLLRPTMYSCYLRAAPGLMCRPQGRSHRRNAFVRTARMSEGKFVKFPHLLCPTLQKNER